ncbi:MAG: helix-hairpin-helix domain-containing protein [Methylococcales bacterium]
MKKLLTLFLLLTAFSCMATPVNVNTADAETLAAALHGIGMKKAQDIVAYRQANGAFKSLEDLGNVKGIGDKTLAKNQADILFSGASAPIPVAVAKTPKAKPAAIPAPSAAAAAPTPAAVAPAAPAPEAAKKPKKAKKENAAPPAPAAAAPATPAAPVANPLR